MISIQLQTDTKTIPILLLIKYRNWYILSIRLQKKHGQKITFTQICRDLSLYIAWPSMTTLYGTTADKNLHTPCRSNQHTMMTQHCQ